MPETQPPHTLRRSLLRGAVVGLVVALLWHVGNILVGPNFHTVLPGAIYRCSQPSPEDLERWVRRHGIRTVINLRGYSDPAPWYRNEARVTARLNVSLEDLGFSASRLPPVQMLRHLLDVLEHSERPILIHCKQGADRTGMASTLALLLFTDLSLPEARRQLGPCLGHLPIGRTAYIDRFFDLYEEWLAGQDLAHAPDQLRRYVHHGYCAGGGRATIEVLGAKRRPLQVPRGRSFTVRVRCHNTSVEPWRFQPGANAGIHVKYCVTSEQARGCLQEDRAGLFFATVAPGEHIDLKLPLRPFAHPGRYQLRVDLMDEQQGSFMQLGSEPLCCELEVS